jgi:hypothetical protein
MKFGTGPNQVGKAYFGADACNRLFLAISIAKRAVCVKNGASKRAAHETSPMSPLRVIFLPSDEKEFLPRG